MKLFGAIFKARSLGSYPARENNFTWIRLLAAFLVIYGHSFAISPTGGGDDWARYLNLPGSHRIGLYVFFLISGYLIMQSIDKRPSLGLFIRSRLFRLLPGLAFSLPVTLALGYIIARPERIEWLWGSFGQGYFLMNFSLVGGNGGGGLGLFETNPLPNSFNGALWSIALEAKCYAVVALAFIAGALRWSWMRNAVLITLFTVLCCNVPADASDALIVQCAAFFAAGGLVYSFRDWLPISLFGAGAMAVLLAALPILPEILHYPIRYTGIGYFVFFAGFAFRLPEPPGDYSYGIYLFGFPAQQLVAFFNPSLSAGIAALIASLAVLPFAIFSWHQVESPVLAAKSEPVDQRTLGFVAQMLCLWTLVAMTLSAWAIWQVALVALGFLVALRAVSIEAPAAVSVDKPSPA